MDIEGTIQISKLTTAIVCAVLGIVFSGFVTWLDDTSSRVRVVESTTAVQEAKLDNVKVTVEKIENKIDILLERRK